MDNEKYEKASILASELDKTLTDYTSTVEDLTVEDVLLAISLLLNNEIETQYQEYIETEDEDKITEKINKIFESTSNESLESTAYLMSQGLTTVILSIMQNLEDFEKESEDK